MSFVCEECLKEKYENQPGFVGSKGPCEDCGKVALCYDIPSSRLQPKRTPFVPLTMEQLDELYEIVDNYSLNGISPFLYEEKVKSLIGMARKYLETQEKKA